VEAESSTPPVAPAANKRLRLVDTEPAVLNKDKKRI
jgi:hypothetical protein